MHERILGSCSADGVVSQLSHRHVGDLVVLWCRETNPQFSDNTLDQALRLNKAVRKFGAVAIKEFHHTGPGRNMTVLRLAARYAKRHGACLLAEAIDRFARPADATQQPGPAEFAKLKTLGVPLLTVWAPDLDPSAVRSLRAKAGQASTGNKGGRPCKPGWKKRRRIELKPVVKRMRRNGESYRTIGRELNISHMTAKRWDDEV